MFWKPIDSCNKFKYTRVAFESKSGVFFLVFLNEDYEMKLALLYLSIGLSSFVLPAHKNLFPDLTCTYVLDPNTWMINRIVNNSGGIFNAYKVKNMIRNFRVAKDRNYVDSK